MKVTIVGTGYVGLVAGTCFAETGHEVICVDNDSTKVNKLKDGIIPIFEPGLEEMVKRNVKEQRLFFTTDLSNAVKSSKVIFIAVGTPAQEDGSADLSTVLAVAKAIAKELNETKVIVNKSTVPVGTADKVRNVVKENTAQNFYVVSNPEFLKEGDALDDFLKPDRVVIGADTNEAFEIMDELYAPFVRQGNPIIHMDNKSAELTKYAANCMLATKISFMNEISYLCEKLNADVALVRKGISTDKRIGHHFLYSGVGYGGSCFPKDVKALIRTAKEVGYSPKIIQSAEDVNAEQKLRFFEKVQKYFNNNLANKKIMVWGLSFKPNTDDMREAPSLVLIENLLKSGAKVHVFDPIAIESAKLYLGQNSSKVCFEKNMYDGLKDSDALMVVTEWNEFRTPDFEKVFALMKTKVIFDGRNIFEPSKIRKLGFSYFGIGRL